MSNGRENSLACSDSSDLLESCPSSVSRTNAEQIRNMSKSVKECIDVQEEEADELESLRHMLDRLTVVNKRRNDAANDVKKRMDRIKPML